MSHFLCLVFTKDAKSETLIEALEPFDENKSVLFVDTTEEYHEEYMSKDDAFKEKYPTFTKYVEEYLDENFDEDGHTGFWKNPDAQWDWYMVGGRWYGYLIHKENPTYPDRIGKGEMTWGMDGRKVITRECSTCALCDVDWEAMKQERLAHAESVWAHLEEEDAKNGGDGKAFGMLNWGREKPYTKEEYVNANASVTPYAMLHNGNWYNKGDMGWFGLSSNEKSCEDWAKEFELALEEIDPEMQVTAVDCHI